jgi:hypothetical protein
MLALTHFRLPGNYAFPFGQGNWFEHWLVRIRVAIGQTHDMGVSDAD